MRRVVCTPLYQPQWCPDGAECDDAKCLLTHPRKRKAACKKLADCPRFDCHFLHPPERTLCDDGDDCTDYHCSAYRGGRRLYHAERSLCDKYI